MEEPISPGLLGTDLEYPPKLPLLAETCKNFSKIDLIICDPTFELI
jgi:hypothetical protein